MMWATPHRRVMQEWRGRGRSSVLKREPQAGDGLGRGFRKAAMIVISIGKPPVMLFIKRAKTLSARLYEFFEGGDIYTIATSPDKLVRRPSQATFSGLRKSSIHQAFGEFVVHKNIVAPQALASLLLPTSCLSRHRQAVYNQKTSHRRQCAVRHSMARIYPVTLQGREPSGTTFSDFQIFRFVKLFRHIRCYSNSGQPRARLECPPKCQKRQIRRIASYCPRISKIDQSRVHRPIDSLGELWRVIVLPGERSRAISRRQVLTGHGGKSARYPLWPR